LARQDYPYGILNRRLTIKKPVGETGRALKVIYATPGLRPEDFPTKY
jgi:hypothetical protein